MVQENQHRYRDVIEVGKQRSTVLLRLVPQIAQKPSGHVPLSQWCDARNQSVPDIAQSLDTLVTLLEQTAYYNDIREQDIHAAIAHHLFKQDAHGWSITPAGGDLLEAVTAHAQENPVAMWKAFAKQEALTMQEPKPVPKIFGEGVQRVASGFRPASLTTVSAYADAHGLTVAAARKQCHAMLDAMEKEEHFALNVRAAVDEVLRQQGLSEKLRERLGGVVTLLDARVERRLDVPRVTAEINAFLDDDTLRDKLRIKEQLVDAVSGAPSHKPNTDKAAEQNIRLRYGGRYNVDGKSQLCLTPLGLNVLQEMYPAAKRIDVSPTSPATTQTWMSALLSQSSSPRSR